jgi:telomere length regulation protein
MTAVLHSDSSEVFATFLRKMKTFEQRKLLNAVISFVAKHYFGSKVEMKDDVPIQSSATVSAAAALIYSLVGDSEILKESLLSALTKSSVPALDDSLFSRRSVLAALAQDEGQSSALNAKLD